VTIRTLRKTTSAPASTDPIVARDVDPTEARLQSPPTVGALGPVLIAGRA